MIMRSRVRDPGPQNLGFLLFRRVTGRLSVRRNAPPRIARRSLYSERARSPELGAQPRPTARGSASVPALRHSSYVVPPTQAVEPVQRPHTLRGPAHRPTPAQTASKRPADSILLSPTPPAALGFVVLVPPSSESPPCPPASP